MVSESSMKSSVKHVELLDYIRGIAIIAVLLFHTISLVYGNDMLPWRGWFRDFSVPGSFLCFLPLSVASAGVSIFFVVSGFCIHMSFQQQGQRWGSFFIRRIFRIYPPYLAALIFSILLIMAYSRLSIHSQDFWMQLLTHLFLIHNCDPSTFSGINTSFWSLAIEAQLYLLYPALLVLVAKLGWRRTMVVLAGCEFLIRGVDGLIQTVDATNTLGGHISWFFACSPFGYWFSWALGAFIADAFLKNQPLPFIKTSPIWWLALAIISYFVKPLDSFRFLLFAVLTAVVTSKLLSGTRPAIKVPALSLVILRKIGLWSYSIYLLHQILLKMYSNEIIWLVPRKYHSAPIVFFFFLVTWLAIIIPFSILWYKLFELPSIALGKRIIKKIDIRHGASEPERLPGNGPAGMISEVNTNGFLTVQKSQVGPNVLQPRSVVDDRTSHVMKGSYCLMIGALLVIAVGNLLIARKLTPPNPAVCNNLAWVLATSPEATHRNGPLAVRLAEYACERTHYKETIMVGTLAAAYAEAGRFDEAISTAQLACALASQSGEQELLQKNQELLALYLNHQPYRDRQASTGK
jgi:peptidoglycan/LPS O-acetylase OafA/YrhL